MEIVNNETNIKLMQYIEIIDRGFIYIGCCGSGFLFRAPQLHFSNLSKWRSILSRSSYSSRMVRYHSSGTCTSSSSSLPSSIEGSACSNSANENKMSYIWCELFEKKNVFFHLQFELSMAFSGILDAVLQIGKIDLKKWLETL